MRWLLTSVVSSALFITVALGTFVPLSDTSGLQYVFVWPGAPAIAAWTLGAAAALLGAYAGVLRGARRRAPQLEAEARRGRWLAPIAALGVAVLGVLPAVPGLGEWTAVAAYFLIDLRGWWLAAALLVVLVQVDRLTGNPVRQRFSAIARWSEPARLLLFDVVLFTLVVVCAIASTRYLRFDTGSHGDEPKYVRYCEMWYQGGGLDVSGNKPFDQIPLDASPKVYRVVPLFVRSVIDESAALAGDLRGFLSDPRGFRWNRAVRSEGFVTGKRGGLYEIYQPGASLFICPGYFLDRYLLSTKVGYNNEFPADAFMSNVALLIVFGLSGVALFRLLRHALASDVLAFVWAAIAMLTLPTAAFAFQFYPEMPACLLIVLVVAYVWFHAPASGTGRAAAAGALAAGVGWFHPRFLLTSAVLAVAGAIGTRPGRPRWAFVAASGVIYASLVFFAYHVTGSFVPTALWEAPGGDRTLTLTSVPSRLVAYALDHMWGIAPHAPLLLAAIPGLAIIAREAPGRAVFLVLVVLALGVPAAGHTLHAAGGTPGRLIMSVVPLLILPAALAIRTFWRLPAVKAATAIALVISLETAFTYNWHHVKSLGAMRSVGLSGWRPNLAFPVLDGEWTWGANMVLLLLLSALAAIAAMGAWRASADATVSPRPMPGLRAAAVFAVVIPAACAATAVNRDWTYSRYLVDDEDARPQAAAALVEHDRCRVCFSTRERAIDWRWLQPNGAAGVNVESAVEARTARVRVVLAGAADALRFGRVLAEFGDQSSTPWTGVIGERDFTHRYAQPGHYLIDVRLQLRNGEVRRERHAVTIAGP